MLSALARWRADPALPRRAAALGVALGLHAALGLAGFGGAGMGGAAVPTSPAAGAAQAAVPPVLWLRLAPAPMPPTPPVEVVSAETHLAAAVAAAQEAPAGSSDQAAFVDVAAQLLQRGSPWALDYPDTDLGAERVVVTVALDLDALRQVQAVQSAQADAAPELVQYVADRLIGAVVDGDLPRQDRLCLDLSFDAAAARVEWRLKAPATADGRCRPPPAA